MRMIDKVLLALAGLCLFAIVLIFNSSTVPVTEPGETKMANLGRPAKMGELTVTPRKVSEPLAKIKQSLETVIVPPAAVLTGTKPAAEKADEMVVFSQEIDKAIEKYFDAIKRNPAQAEEERRLIGEDNGKSLP